MSNNLIKSENNKIAKEYEKELKKFNKKIQDKETGVNKKKKKKNVNKFKKMLKEEKQPSDIREFKKLSLKEQSKMITELDKINKIAQVNKPMRLSIIGSDIPDVFKAEVFKKIKAMRYMDPDSGEYHKTRGWIDSFMKIPLDKYSVLPVNKSDGIEKSHEFIKNAKQTLDDEIYGMEDVKLQIIQVIGQWLVNPDATACAIGIEGPAGTGKTSIAKNALSKILQRPASLIPLGGMEDGCALVGHSSTYEGSKHGLIIEKLKQAQVMNPIFVFDELDKVSKSAKGEEIIGILTHMTDKTQSDQFNDKFFNEFNFDLSKALLIFCYNDPNEINKILLDRMYKMKTSGYNAKDKLVIARDYLLPSIREQIMMTEDEVVFTDEILNYIIENYTKDEKGVRNLKRCLEIILTKINLFRLMKPDENLFKDKIDLEVTFPYTLTKESIEKIIVKDKTESPYIKSMYV